MSVLYLTITNYQCTHISFPSDSMSLRFFTFCRYFAPEYAENGTCSVKTDVYAFGILLIQLISGRKAVDSTRDDHQQSIRHWVCYLPLGHHILFFKVFLYRNTINKLLLVYVGSLLFVPCFFCCVSGFVVDSDTYIT